MSERLKFLTVLKSGGEYKSSHVYALRDQVNQWIPEADFICLTDADLECDTIELEENLPGWWSKLELFKIEGPILYCDLDTVIVGSCSDWIERIKDFDFVCLRDVYRGKRNKLAMGSGIMYWSGDMRRVWDAYCQDAMPTDIPGGDQSYLEAVIRRAKYLQDYADNVVSYKSDIRDGNYKVKDASIVYFHGKPRPWELKEPIAC
jgi:hypothetical protein